MISVNIAGHRFQLRAAAVVVHEGFVLLRTSQNLPRSLFKAGMR